MKWTFDLLAVFILGGMKLSVIFFYRRLFRGKVFDLYSKLWSLLWEPGLQLSSLLRF